MVDRQTNIGVLIADDESAARARIVRILNEVDGLMIVGQCANGSDVPKAVEELRPDLLVLDIEMPGLTGLGVVRALGAARPLPLIIFVTAYAEYAVRAFDACALDYVLKPFEDDRLLVAIERARKQIQLRNGEDPRMRALADFIERDTARATDVITVRLGMRYVVQRVHEIDWIGADGNDCVLHVAPGRSGSPNHSETWKRRYSTMAIAGNLPGHRTRSSTW